jgi:hypothetical protein
MNTARALCALALFGCAANVHAQFTVDANTIALWHFDAQTAEGTTPDSGPNGFDGTLAGAVLPTHQQATLGGYGWAYKFDGVDRTLDNSRINMGVDPQLGFRGAGDWSLDVLVTVTSPLADDGYFRGILCRASPGGIDYSVSYSSWTHPTYGPEHEFWFTTGVATGVSPDYTYAATYFAGLMEMGSSYAIRVTSSGGTITITENGSEGTTVAGPLPPLTPIAGDLTVGDSCPEDFVTLPSELQIDEFRISDLVRTDGLIPPLPSLPLPLLQPLSFQFTDAQGARQYRADRPALARQSAPVPAAPTPTAPTLTAPTGTHTLTPTAPTGLRARR